MTVFKTFWKVVKKYKGTILLYTIMLIAFGGINMQTSDNQINFTNSKPDIFIVNKDSENKITENLIQYMENHSHIIPLQNNEEAINDAIFYRDVNYVIYIPENYGTDIINGQKPTIAIKSTGDYQASLAEMLLSRYLRIQNIYQTKITKEADLIQVINQNLDKQTTVKITSKLDTTKTTNATFYFNFASYSIMAVTIYIVCLVLSSFHEKTIHKRTVVSSMNYKVHNRNLLLASCIYAIIVWLLFTLLGVFILKDIMFTSRGLIYILNAFLFTFCSLTIAFLISTLIHNKNAISGIINVIALGSAFLCGAFVPTEWLPSSVLQIAHLLPAYWYINTNDLLKTMEVVHFENLQPIFINMLVITSFSVLFIIINSIISKKKLIKKA